MAQVKMDASEYEEMKKNARLLEEALAEQKKLHEENKKLKEEKIKALEDAKMKVVKITKDVKVQHALTEKDPEMFLQDFSRAIGRLRRIHSNSNSDFGIRSFSDFEFRQLLEGVPKSRILHEVRDCFYITELKEGETVETTTHGLDDIKAELRAELDKEYKEDIEKAREIESKHEEIPKELNDAKLDSADSNKLYDSLFKDFSEVKEEKEEVDAKLNTLYEIVSEIKTTFSEGYSIFTQGNFIKKIKRTIDKV